MQLGYSSATAGIYDIEQAFRLAQELDLNFIELSYDYCNFLPNSQPKHIVNELRQATGIQVSLHLPFIDLNIASLIPAVRQTAVDQTLKALDYAQAIHATCAILHTGTFFIYQPVPAQKAYEALLISLAKFKDSDVPIALENLGLYLDGLIREPENLKALTDEIGFYNCLDFGHAHIETCRPWRKEDLRGEDLTQKYIDVLAHRIIHLHLCNNDGQNDLHTATNNGSLVYEQYQKYLQGFRGSICLEVAGGRDSVKQSAKHIRTLINR